MITSTIGNVIDGVYWLPYSMDGVGRCQVAQRLAVVSSASSIVW
jgi:hypothetical protein